MNLKEKISPIENIQQMVEIYADGACKGNPGPGGWGAWMLYDGKEKTLPRLD